MIIRKAQSKDSGDIFILAKSLATSFTVNHESFNKSFQHCLTDESFSVLVAESNSEIVGYLLGFDHLTFFANGSVAGVEEVYVVPNFRGKGFGKALMREFEKWAKSRNSAQIVVSTRRASEFYKAIGYEETAICFRYLI